MQILRKTSQFVSLHFIPVRALHSSTSCNGIFSSRSTTPKPSEAQTDVDQPLTPFQARIAELEIKAHAHKEDPDAQLAFLRQLSEGGEFAGLVAYYEGMALAEDTSGSRALLKDDEAWGIFMDALARSGRLGDIATMVRRRDRLLASIGAHGGSSPSAPLVSSPMPPSGSANNLSTSTSSATSPGSSMASPLLSQVVSPTPLANASNASTQSHPGAGSPLNPIYVQMAPPTPQMNAWRALRWVAGFLLWGFIILTVMSMVIENTGLLKAGPGPVEFEPEEGKIVKFSDVHGVGEAKAVIHHLPWLAYAIWLTFAGFLGIGGNCGVSQKPGEVLGSWGQTSKRSTSDWPSWYR